LQTYACIICVPFVVVDSFAGCPHDDRGKTRGKKRTSFDTERHSNKCFRADVSASDDDADDGTARCDDDAQTETTGNNMSAPTRLIPKVGALPVDLLPEKVLRCSESPTCDSVALTSNIHEIIDDVAMTSSKLPLPVISSTARSQGPDCSGSHCSGVANNAKTYCGDEVADDVALTSSNLLPVVSLTTKTVCRGATTIASSVVSPVGTSGLSPSASRVGRILHSAAGVFPFPVPITISQQAPFVVGCSTMTLRPSVIPLGTGRLLPVPQAVPSHQYPQPLPLISPTAVPADYFRKQRVCYGLGSPQIGYYGATSGDPSDLALRPSSAEVAARVPDAAAARSARLLPRRSSSVDPLQSAPTCESSHESNEAADDVIAKLDPVSRAVYDNFLGKLRTTTRPKNRSGRRRGHVTNDVTRRYRD